MNYQQIDFIFPFVVFFYGFFVSFVLCLPQVSKWLEVNAPSPMQKQLLAHRVLAMICLWVGSIWSLQNLWYNSTPMF
ncbi:MAG: hypothetical protein MK008_07190 [Bdellovibrionales bacterium]|nr:hypothetical protein [Bdellovibrionales bacterium]